MHIFYNRGELDKFKGDAVVRELLKFNTPTGEWRETVVYATNKADYDALEEVLGDRHRAAWDSRADFEQPRNLAHNTCPWQWRVRYYAHDAKANRRWSGPILMFYHTNFLYGGH